MSSRIHSDYKVLPAFRVEWRPNLVTAWTILTHHAQRKDAEDAAAAGLQQFKGQLRVVSQTVVHGAGLGA